MQITLVHWVYLISVVVILGIMLTRRDIVIPCIVGIAIIGFVLTGNMVDSFTGTFNAMVYAGKDLFNVILLITCIVAMSKVIEDIGANELMVRPFIGTINSPGKAFWITGFVMLIASWLFWPSPATALVGIVFLPVALKAGLPAIGAAMAMNLFGHGIGLSSDYVIQGAPTITAQAAGINTSNVIIRGIPLVLVMSITTVVIAYFVLRRDMVADKIIKPQTNTIYFKQDVSVDNISRFGAVIVPLTFLVDIIIMLFYGLNGDSATALIGGSTVGVLILLSVIKYKNEALEKVIAYLKDGFTFAFQIFGPVIPIAAFFYLGELAPITAVFGNVLPTGSMGILSDVGLAVSRSIPINKPIAAACEVLVGGITGLDGSGFSGMSLAGSVARIFGTAIKGDVGVLAALGQVGAIWVGGGTIIPWAVVPVAAIAGIKPIDLVKRNFLPVMIGLIVTTVTAMFLV